MKALCLGSLLLLGLAVGPFSGVAAGPRILPAGKLPDDLRLGPLKDLDGYFPFQPPSTKEAWRARADLVRRRVLVANGLWPLPEKTPLNAIVYGRLERQEYSIEKVFFESRPGFFVTGNLYRPKQITGKVPGVLFAHGHWTDARLAESTEPELRQEIASGQERFEQGGRSRFQSMCVQLARMGCVVFQYDMLGNSDSQQISLGVAHNFAKQRPHLNTVSDWGLFSPQAEAHLQSVMGLQTWNSVRSLDFLLSLPEVDPARIACTGASGGGTQTFNLGAIDPRVQLEFPAVMVSTGMQGGCTCENASLLRIGTGNVELAALFAPKPLGMTSANDWTKEMATKGFPQLKQLYGLLDAPDNVMLNRGEHFPHNYNAVSRSAFYTWLNHHFHLDQTEPVIEHDYRVASREELSVWDATHPHPPGGEDYEQRLLRQIHEADQRQIETATRTDEQVRAILKPAWQTLLDTDSTVLGKVTWDQITKTDHATYIEMGGFIRNSNSHSELPTVFLYPKNWQGQTVVWATGHGKAGLYTSDGMPIPAVQQLMHRGVNVLGLDLLDQGEFVPEGIVLSQSRLVAGPREVPAYTFGYNNSVFVERVHDLITAIQYIRQHERKSSLVALVGTDGAGPIVAAARFALGNQVDRTALDTGGFRFGQVLNYRDLNFLPGGAKYGDLPELLALGGPGEIRVAGESAATLTATPKLKFGKIILTKNNSDSELIEGLLP